MEETTKKSNKWVWLFMLIVIVVVLILWSTGGLTLGVGRSDTYQAVFLTNNQVYFGKLARAEAEYPVLKEVYYLQITQTLQPKEEDAAPISNINLVKLGGEIHGPTDEMRINRIQILFIEDLKADSQVVTAIKQYQESQKQQ